MNICELLFWYFDWFLSLFLLFLGNGMLRTLWEWESLRDNVQSLFGGASLQTLWGWEPSLETVVEVWFWHGGMWETLWEWESLWDNV